MRVTLYTRPACGLCRDAEELLARLRQKIHFDLEIVDIDKNSPAHDEYWERIPVVTVNGAEVAAGRIDGGQLRKVLTSG